MNYDLVGVFLINEFALKLYDEKYYIFNRTVIGKMNLFEFLA